MKHINNIILCCMLSASFILGGCSNKEGVFISEEKYEKHFTADIEPFAQTKTILDGDTDDDMRAILWHPNDSIAVTTAEGYLNLFVNTNTEISPAGSFSGTVSESDVYYASYPHKYATSFSEGTISIVLPEEQKYADDTFYPGLFPMVARSSNSGSFSFKNLCGMFVIKLIGEGEVESIEFSGKDVDGNPLKISGEATVDMNFTETPVIRFREGAGEIVKLICKEAVELNSSDPEPFYLVLPPNVYHSFTLKITLSDGRVMVKQSVNPLTIVRCDRATSTPLEYTQATIDLSLGGTANCYIVPSAGEYSFNSSVIGNGEAGLLPDISQSDKGFHTESVNITPLSAQLLWEDVDELISNVKLVEGKVLFTASQDKGNAVIAVYDNENPSAEGAKILWSWHIWCTDTPAEQIHANAEGRNYSILDRNLGATRANPGSTDAEKLETYGVLYQWGRKDPFPGSSNPTAAEYKTLYGAVTAIDNYSSGASIAYSAEHPATFIYGGNIQGGSYGWLDNENYKYLWGNPDGYDYATAEPRKSIYDPCPVGYRVVPRDAWTGFSISNVSGSFDNGFHFYLTPSGEGETAWYPATGYISYNGGYVYAGIPGTIGIYNSSAYNGTFRKCQMSVESSTIDVLYPNGAPAEGSTVRCVHEYQGMAPGIPTVTTSEVSSILSTSAASGGNVTSDGGESVTSRGVCWSTSENPTIDDYKTSDGTGTGSFTSSITGLNANTTYYLRAYATNSAGTAYGEQKQFITEADLPTLTMEISEVSKRSISVISTLVNDNGMTVTETGVCWGESPDLTYYSDNVIVCEDNTNPYTIEIPNLTPGSRYYVRAYAKTNVDEVIGYSDILDTLTVYPWYRAGNVAGADRTQAVSFTINNKAYIGTGSYRDDFWEFDPENNTWTQKANYPAGGVNGLVAFAIGGNGYVGMGNLSDGTVLPNFYKYDTALNTWTRVKDYQGEFTSGSYASFVVSEKGYVCCDRSGRGYNPETWEYDPNSNSWTQKASYTSGNGVFHATAFSINGKGYLLTYCTWAASCFLEYNPTTDTWIGRTYPPVSYLHSSSFVINDKAYVASGWIYGQYTSAVCKYDPITDSWSTLSPFVGTLRCYNIAFSIGGKGYFGTGGDVSLAGSMKDLWIYDPSLED